MTDIVTDDWFSDEHATFGDRLAAAREAASLSQKDLAKRLGVKSKTVAAWENDLSEPRANRLQMLAGLLNVSLMWLLNGNGEGVDPPGVEPALTHDARRVLLEMRELRGDIDEAANRLARLEKNLKKLMEASLV
ncbi:helix-turn-helix domain-containing protein [Maritimibacter sp. HL-12]|jgi:HTH-type transcriptional regulator, cell division transcriptional repressor|uniref:helix-turn-helix domain-containing protein n=1 Tax=Maritimibacter sp. HL-12 TaxID=1162418 RepID=UPI000A0F3282|nr:helix-turn-helix domain-containing protein [Maritimibacter sp. HL-12]SMH35209.1 Predicted transcription factor, homolog of eukaryotic MBF1 [Maritimibacter sp. HL-12]